MLGALSFEGPLVFCGSETRGIIGVEESRDGIRSANSTLRKEAYGGNFLQHCNSTTGRFVWRIILRFITRRASSSKGFFIFITLDLGENLLKWIYSTNIGVNGMNSQDDQKVKA